MADDRSDEPTDNSGATGVTKPRGDTARFHQGGMHAGMPPLDPTAPPLSHFEFWRPNFFYLPIYFQIAWLSLRYWGATLPSVANPHFPDGGFFGEHKSGILDTVSEPMRRVLAPYLTARVPEAETDRNAFFQGLLARCADAGLSFPMVVKPDVGSRGAGVRLLKTPEDLRGYVDAFPAGHIIMLQAFVPYEAEAGVFYVRMPGEDKGRIFSLTLKYFPYITGDGRSTIRELIENDPRAGQIAHLYLPRHKDHLDNVLAPGEHYRLAFAGSHSRGTIFKDGADYITPEMTEAFDRVAKGIPEFHFGRFDVRFPDIADLQRGEKFLIIEINGAGSEATHIWDSRTTLWQAWSTLFEQWSLLYRIGFMNRRRGFKPMRPFTYLRAILREVWLVPQYPPTE